MSLCHANPFCCLVIPSVARNPRGGLLKVNSAHPSQLFSLPDSLRKQLGVWYTPHEIVQYMVERVDRVLRDELKVADGLADKNVRRAQLRNEQRKSSARRDAAVRFSTPSLE